MHQHLFLLRELVKRDFKARYAGSLFGFLWSFVTPIWQLLMFTFVFSTVMRISLLGERTDSFAVFLFCGLLPWAAFQEGVQRASTAVTDNANLVKKQRFPSQILILTVVLAAVVHQAIASALFGGYLAVTGQLHVGGLPVLLLALPLQLAMTIGLGLLLATAHVFFRDIAQVVGLAFLGWFYITPIVYPLSMVPPGYRRWLEFNPVTALVGLYRQAFLGGEGLPAGTRTLVIVAALILSVGIWLFGHFKPAFVDEL